MKHDDNSYQEYKKYLQKSLGISSVPAPKAPMNPYLRFFLQRSSEERSKGQKNIKDLAKSLSEQWKNLSANKKEYYQKIYTIRLRQKNALLQEYLILSGKHKIMPPYARFVKKRYAQYSKEHKNSTSSEINKLVKNDWKSLSQKEKTKLQDQYEKQKNDAILDIDNSDRLAQYNDRLERYHQLLNEDKEKVLKKYGFTKQNKARLRKIEKEQERLKKNAQRQLEREQRQRELRQQKLKIREAKLKKLRQEKEAQRKLKEQQKQKQKDQKLKAKNDQADKKKKQSDKTKKLKGKKEAVKVEAKPSASKSKSKAVEKPQAKKVAGKKAQKTKLIKKPVTKEAKKGKESAKAGKGSKTKAKAKGKGAKGGKGKGAKRGKKGK